MVLPIILCGGSGTRLWPLSRAGLAKQLAPLFDGESLLQLTLRRVAGRAPFETPLIVAGAEGRFMVREQADAAAPGVEIALEPARRDTLAAIAAAAFLAARRGPETVALVMPSDHLIPDAEAFARAAESAAAAAAGGGIVTLGLKPTHPATGYGYIEPGAEGSAGARRVARFVEKPDAAKAEALIAAGALWNAGMFCFRADALIAELERLEPATAAAVRKAVEEASDDLGFRLLGPSFEEARAISFDFAVMEKTEEAMVAPAAFEWSDIGDWKAFWASTTPDADGVTLEGDAFARDVRNAYIRADDRLVCAVGVEDVAIVETADAVLVAGMDKAQEVKALVGALAAEGRAEANEHARVYRPWGWYQTMDLGERFRVKRINVKPGAKLSLQKHHHRAEHWVVVRGTAEVTVGEDVSLLRENESVYIPMGELHRLANPGKIPAEIIEVQTGAYLEEDDIVRIQDDFGRT